MCMIKKLLLVGVSVFSFWLECGASTIDNFQEGPVDEIGLFGESANPGSSSTNHTNYIGQTFIAPAESLAQSLEFVVKSFSGFPDILKFRVLITEMQLNGQNPGTVLFESVDIAPPAGQFSKVTVNLNGTHLTEGATYAFILDSRILFDGVPGLGVIMMSHNRGNSPDTYPDGKLILPYPIAFGNDRAQNFSQPWVRNGSGADIAFRMQFGDAPLNIPDVMVEVFHPQPEPYLTPGPAAIQQISEADFSPDTPVATFESMFAYHGYDVYLEAGYTFPLYPSRLWYCAAPCLTGYCATPDGDGIEIAAVFDKPMNKVGFRATTSERFIRVQLFRDVAGTQALGEILIPNQNSGCWYPAVQSDIPFLRIEWGAANENGQLVGRTHVDDFRAEGIADTEPPNTSAQISAAPNAAEWNNTNVIVTFQATDNLNGTGVKEINITLSGAQSGIVAVNGNSASAAITTEGTTSLTFYSTDNAGNQEEAKQLTIHIDKTLPIASTTTSPGPNGNGWNNSNVTVSFAGIDSLSGIDSCTSPIAFNQEGVVQAIGGTCTDKAGNVSAPTSAIVSIDKTPPVISGAPALDTILWPPNKKMVDIATINATDELSGLTSFTVTAISNEPSDPQNPDIVITGSGLGPYAIQLRAKRLGKGSGRIYTITSTATDLAGNVTTTISIVTVPHDKGK
jgi:hypothetical protein